MELDKAKEEADQARAALLNTASNLKERLTPQSLLEDGKAVAKDQAVKLAAVTLASSKGRPLLAAGAMLAGALYLFRKPIARAVKGRLGKENDHG